MRGPRNLVDQGAVLLLDFVDCGVVQFMYSPSVLSQAGGRLERAFSELATHPADSINRDLLATEIAPFCERAVKDHWSSTTAYLKPSP